MVTTTNLAGVCLVFSLASLLLPCSGTDAPHENCINLPHNARAEFETQLMDSYTHEVLLPEIPSTTGAAVWSEFSFDGNDDPMNDTPSWVPIISTSECRRNVKVCGWDREGERQDNWLYFDPNTFSYPVEIHVDINFRVSNCRGLNVLGEGCNRRFELHKYETNTKQPSSTEGQGFMNRLNYERFAVENTPGRGLTITMKNSTFTLPSSSTGFYIAVRDTGSCLAILRMRVYRNNCKSRQVGLVLYPDAPAPVTGSENIDIGCVENAVVSGSSRVTCSSDGTWGSQSPVCQCRPGYVTDTTACNACPAGQFRSEENAECQDCPANTVSPRGAAAVCPCSDGYFRNTETHTHPDALKFVEEATETASNDCTKPPSAPPILSLSPQQSSITVRWSAPADLGGRTDLYYQVEISDPDNLGSYTGTVFLRGSSTTISSLRPHTQYCVRVTSHNGVSDQDPGKSELRTTTQCEYTLESEPGPVSNLISIYPIVLWQKPLRPNGVILRYELTFTRNGSTETATTNALQTFFAANEESLPEGPGSFTVQVRAINSAGSGESLCQLTVNPDICSAEPQRCTVCEERTVGLVRYPATAVPQGEGSVAKVTAECVENAVPLGPSLEVTCSWDGVWGSEEPQCECIDYYIEEASACTAPTDEPPSDPPSQSTNNITTNNCPEVGDTGSLSKTTTTSCDFPLVAVLITFAATATGMGLLATVVLILVVVGFKRKLRTAATSGHDGNAYSLAPVKTGL